MKVSVAGAPKLLDGTVAVPVVIGEGSSAREVDIPLAPDDLPPGGWESLAVSAEPHRIDSLSGKDHAFWLYRGKVVQITETAHLTDEEQKLEVAHAVLRQEKRYRQLRRQLEAYANIERADVARRERIPDDVRLFVWQRDQGKCVRCGCAERLEFDHIIPVAEGGGNGQRNIQLLCEACNRAKGTNI